MLGRRWNIKSRLRKRLPIFFLTRPSGPATALYAVPLVFGLVALLTKNPIFRTLVPLAVPLVTFLGLAWWADRKEMRSLLSELKKNADALLMTCRRFSEQDIGKWRADPITLTLMPVVTRTVWESVMERARLDASVRAVARYKEPLSRIYAQISDLPVISGTFPQRLSWPHDISAAPTYDSYAQRIGFAHLNDPSLPRNVFQFCLVYLDLAETLYGFVTDQDTRFATQVYREQGAWVVKARAFLKEADMAWSTHLVANPNREDAKERRTVFDKKLDELLEAYNQGP